MDTPFPFFHTVKTAPEEWRQMSAMLSPQARSTVRPVHCDVLDLPASEFIRLTLSLDRSSSVLQFGSSANVTLFLSFSSYVG